MSRSSESQLLSLGSSRDQVSIAGQQKGEMLSNATWVCSGGSCAPVHTTFIPKNGVGMLLGPGKVKGLQQECERHCKSGALVRSEKNASVATDILLEC